MFCDKCGAGVSANQGFCQRCGRELRGNFIVAYPAPGRVESHARLLGIFWIAISALNLLGGFFIFIVANGIVNHIHDFGGPPNFPAAPLHAFLTFLGIVVFCKAAFGLAAGVGLLQREPWARMMTIVLSFIALLAVPFGTALGIYGLWVLLPAESEREYDLASKTTAA